MEHSRATLFLNIIWHQHQPLYLDPGLDQLRGPWVRTHATKDYYDMAAILSQYPEVHCTFNLTSSLLVQIEAYYVARLKPYVDVKKRRVDAKRFFEAWRGKTDPWIDLALKPTGEFDDRDRQRLLSDPWNALYIGEVMLARFPEYKSLKEKQGRGEPLSEQEQREVKFWFFLAYFDPDFLERPVRLVDGETVDLTDLIGKKPDGSYRLKRPVTEELCNRIVAETYLIMANIVPVHARHMYHPRKHHGQIDIITTPFYHPILPLLIDSDAARDPQPGDPLPSRFQYPADAEHQVRKALLYCKKMFGIAPRGMWPAEGAVSEAMIPALKSNNILWIATDEHILERSAPPHLPKYYPYNVGGEEGIAVVFRDTGLSDKIGFTYQSWKGEAAAEDFIGGVLGFAPPVYESDRLLTVILDGENAWEWYREDNDGKTFLHSLYGRLEELYRTREVITVTMSEYIYGNPHRHVPPHPPGTMNTIERLHPGSWINANYDTWIGSREKNQAWEYLRTAREDLERSGIAPPKETGKAPAEGSRRWYADRAWEAVYAAEGSDWFWWYGTKQFVPGGTAPFDDAFIGLLNNVYQFARRAGARMPERSFTAIAQARGMPSSPGQGTMKRGGASLPQQSTGR